MNQTTQIASIKGLPNQVFNHSMMNQAPMVFFSLGTTLVTLYLTLVFPWATQWIAVSASSSFAIPVPLFVIIPLVLLGKLIHDLKNTKFVLCPDYVLFIDGIIGWKEVSLRMGYEHIHEIEIEQTILQRILGTGDLTLLSIASSGNQKLRMDGLRSPRQVKNLIQERMSGTDADDVTGAAPVDALD